MAGRRPFWLLAIALASLLLLPGIARGQGLRSATATVSLVATRAPDGARRFHDLSWQAGTLGSGDSAVLIREGGPVADSVYVRDASNRLVLVDARGVQIAGPSLQLRVVTSSSPAGPWPLVLRVRSALGTEERRHLLRPVQPR